jgi:hypothetical protein
MTGTEVLIPKSGARNCPGVTPENPGSACVSRVGFDVAPKRTFRFRGFHVSRKVRDGETHALPRQCANRALILIVIALLIFGRLASSFAQADPASEPAVLAVGKVLPAVVNINTERMVRRTVRDPFEDFTRNSSATIESGRAKFVRLCKASARVSLSIRPVTS